MGFSSDEEVAMEPIGSTPLPTCPMRMELGLGVSQILFFFLLESLGFSGSISQKMGVGLCVCV